MIRERRPADFWCQLVEEFESSEFTQVQFSRTKGVKVATFRKWLYKIRNQELEQAVEFVEVKSTQSSHCPSVSIFLPQDLMIGFSQCPDARFVAQLVHELSKLPC